MGISRYSYWAFISYSWADARQAKSLHRRLERFGIPLPVRRTLETQGPQRRRLRPVFRDEDEMSGSGVLGDRLRDAIDRSAAMVLLASPESARSPYVELELDRFVSTRELDRLAIVVLGDGGDRRPPLPASLQDLREEPLWIDCRDTGRLTGRALVRVAATILGVDFDLLWQRHRRRRRKFLAAWAAFAMLVGMVVGTALWRQDQAEKLTPERQMADFREFYADRIDVDEDALSFDFSRTDDLNGDGLIDYFVDNQAQGFCGSSGCGLDVYLTRSPGDYVEVLSLLGESDARVRRTGDGAKQIVTTHLSVSRKPVYSVYSLVGDRYAPTGYEFCDGVRFEYCEPMLIEPLPAGNQLKIIPGTLLQEQPDPAARAILVDEEGPGVLSPDGVGAVVGVLPGGEWYLVDSLKGAAGFVPAAAVYQ